jgi:hypothetical protein
MGDKTKTGIQVLEEKEAKDAPSWYSAAEASAWASGYNEAAALSRMPGEAVDGLPGNLAELIEEEMRAWRGANGAIHTIRACAIGVSVMLRASAATIRARAANTETESDAEIALRARSDT